MVAASGYEEATKYPKTKYSEERRNVIHGIQDHPHIKKSLFQDHHHHNPQFQAPQVIILAKLAQLHPPNQAAYLL